MQLKVNRHAPFEDPDRTAVEARVIQRVEEAPQRLIDLYKRLPESMGGRYINSDLFKEVFPEYAASPAHRTVFNVPVHNSAAVLANALFHEMVAENTPHRNRILFITGIPGAGKSTAIQKNALDLSDYKVIYEGQLSNYEQAKEKIIWCLKNNCDVDVFSFHRDPESALRNTFLRFTTLGRGASISAMSNIQGNLGESIEKLYKNFSDTVTFCTIDLRSDSIEPVCGTLGINILKSEGSVYAIRERLECELGKWRESGRISEACYREAAGRSPFSLATLQKIHEKSLRDRCATSGQSRSSERTCENIVVNENISANQEHMKKNLHGMFWEEKETRITIPHAGDTEKALHIFRKNIVPITWNHLATLEQNPATLPQTETILKGQSVGGVSIDQLLQVKNYGDGAKKLATLLSTGSFALNEKIAGTIHGFVGKEDALTWGVFRNSNVMIQGIGYMPPPCDQLAALAEKGFSFIRNSLNPQEGAIATFLFMSRLQFFHDANKRTASLMMNGVLLESGYFPITILNRDSEEFHTKLAAFYTSGDATGMMKFFEKTIEKIYPALQAPEEVCKNDRTAKEPSPAQRKPHRMR